MKAIGLLLLLASSAVLSGAQNSTVPAKDVNLRMRVGDQAYCKGQTGPPIAQAQGPNDIILSVVMKVWYENHRPEKVVLPGPFGFRMKAQLPGQNVPIIERIGSGGTRDVNNTYFETTTVDPQPGPGPDLLQCLASTDPGCSRQYIYIPVVDRGTGLDLRGKTVEVVLTRDHTIPADAVEKLKAKVKTEQVLSANVESQVLSIAIPSEPSTRDCRAIPLAMK
jgi:hypothetical protein